MKTLSKYLFKYLQSLFILFTFSVGSSSLLHAQQVGTPYTASLTRYVATETDGGKYANDGLSWHSPKNYLQDAINELHQYMEKNGIREGGRIFVKAGIYTPTESTEKNSDGILYTSFKIYEGITVYGGFSSRNEEDPQERVMKEGAVYAWEFANETILSGGHVSTPCTFSWNDVKQEYDALFPGNSYHVVWFATNGFSDKAGMEKRARKLKAQAGVDGCIIEGGNASHSSLTERRHTAYGGGAYMVENSFVRNSIFRKNEARRRGGAVYLDGGGLVQNCYFHTNQCAGVGGFEGYGGAVAIDQKGKAEHCIMVNNMARIGGGISLNYMNPTSYPFDVPLLDMGDGRKMPNPYIPVAVSCLIANNTSSQEAGGIYFNQGGTGNRLTVVNNRCNGEDVIIGGIRYGRSGGAYILKCGAVFNSVFWGGTVKNQNVQMAVFDPKSDPIYQYARVSYSAFENHDLVDWSAVNKRGVFNLEGLNSLNDVTGTEKNMDSAYPEFSNPSKTSGVIGGGADYLSVGYDWKPMSSSALRQHSVQIGDLPSVLETQAYAHAESTRDLHEQLYSPRGVLGAYLADRENIRPYVQGKSVTLYVDPNQQTLQPAPDGSVGSNWDFPLNNLNRALDYFREHQEAENVMRILVKEGLIYTTGNFYNTHIRSSNIEMAERVEVYGGYGKMLRGTDESDRNPLEHVTRITGDIMDDAYANNVCHLVSFNDINHAVLDGFYISHANSVSRIGFENDESLGGRPAFQHGGGIICRNANGKKNMVGNVVRNCLISNCTALLGSAVYVCAEPSTQVSLAMENCVIHNNESVIEAPFNQEMATVYVEAKGRAHAGLDLLHCNIIKNVGHPVVTRQGTEGTARVTLNNSVVWANTNQKLASSEILENESDRYLLRLGAVGNLHISGSYCCLDQGTSQASLTESVVNLTYANSHDITKTYPECINATKNIGITEHGDATYYGGTPDFTPTNLSPLVNAASELIAVDTDLAGDVRTYGGLPDVGALENKDLPLKGKVIYVRDFGPGRESEKGGDGSSWSKAINGNSTAYVNDHKFEGVETLLYPENYQLTGLQWAVDEAYRRSLDGYEDKSSYMVNGIQEEIHCEPIGDYGQKTEQPKRTIRVGKVNQQKLVQVWVAQGEYIRTDGFFMRDGVDVFGGFPVEGNPGMRERSPKVYETILETNTTESVNSSSFNNWGRRRGSCNQREEGDLFTYPLESVTYSKEKWTASGTTDTENGITSMSPDYVSNIIDNNPQTQWTGKIYHNNGQTIFIIDFGSRIDFDRVLLQNLQTWAKCNIDLYVGNQSTTINDKVWGESYSDAINFSKKDITLGSNVVARFLKIVVTTTYTAIVSGQSNIVYLGEVSVEKNFKVGRYYDLNAYKNAYIGQRVLTQPFPYYARKQINATNDDNKSSAESIEYHNIPLNTFSRMTTWNGFSIQNGRTRISHQRDGGAGVALRHNGRIENCVIRNNYNKGKKHVRGGAIFCNGGEIVNCVVENNRLETDVAGLGGGLYLRLGTVYNTCLSDNSTLRDGRVVYDDNFDGAAVFFENGVFYNNTITKNNGYHTLKTGNWFENGKIQIYNSIIYGNTNGDGKDLVANTSFAVVEKCLFADDTKYEPIDNVKKEKQIFGNPQFADWEHNDFTLMTSSPAINAGLDNPGGIVLPSFDANYDARIQDCRVDIGAFETNTAYAISGAKSNDGYYNYYVAQNGLGNASASSPQNAACSQKLQLVLDAAGRYKLANPGKNVRVCLAGDGKNTGFAYHPTRSAETDEMSRRYENPRSYSLIVPRGVEVWGGYSDTFTERDAIKNPTRFSGIYESESQRANVYHVVTFTETVFSEEQKPVTGSNLKQIAGRAVLDGLFLIDGEANGEGESEMYGGAAIVTDYAHVRNCILEDNRASVGGGALYLRPGALVSGCLFKQNRSKDGGAVYVEPLAADAKMSAGQLSHIYTSTLVDNTAKKSGGGIYYQNNVYVSSSVIWQNHGSSQANISGRFEYSSRSFEGKAPETGLYPFAYCAVENMRLPGTNNQGVATEVQKGVRFVPLNQDAYYGLTDYSVLLHRGMPIETYQTLVNTKGLASTDFRKSARLGVTLSDNFYIDAGARSLGKRSIELPSKGKVLKRLFVSHPDIIDMEVASKVIANSRPDVKNTFQGATFAYPMQHLDDALRYIHNARADKSIPDDQKKNFEIYLSAGTFYPTYNYTSEGKPVKGNSRENTFLVPEGVKIIGGINPNNPDGKGYYCQDEVSGGTGAPQIGGVRLYPVKMETILKERPWYDLNSNDIFEPWEMRFQTILSGHNPNLENSNNVYHVVTVLPIQNTVQQRANPANRFTQAVMFDGVQITEGSACPDGSGFQEESHYKGGGLYFNGLTPDSKIPMVIRNCRFMGNKAGKGGAIYTNAPLGVYSCAFEQNMALSQDAAFGEQPQDKGGYGSAVFVAESRVDFINSLFANNEARSEAGQGKSAGTVVVGRGGNTVMLNSNMVNNLADVYPAVFSFETNKKPGAAGDKILNNILLNSIFWGNKAKAAGDEYQYVINFDQTDLAQAQEALWFCAYEKGRAKAPVLTKDFRAGQLTLGEDKFALPYIPDMLKDGSTYNNCNIYLSSDNYTLDGPNFTNPSLGAGVDYFMVSANWMVYRQNNLTDNGWTYLNQKIETIPATGTHNCQFVDEQGRPGISGAGAYYTKWESEGHMNLPLGTDTYMKYKDETAMHRVSLDPNPTHNQTYIDIGLYEYQHRELNPQGDDRDILWVSEEERPKNGPADGSSWERPTSDLQRAIETLLSGRNGRHKEIRIMDGTYNPVYVIGNNLGFSFNTKNQNETVTTPADEIQKIPSFTIQGGWSSELSGIQNPEDYPTVIQLSGRSGIPENNLKHLFNIANAKQYDVSLNETGEIIPIRMDGLILVNPYGTKDGGAAVYYQQQLKEENAQSCNPSGRPKLTLSNCIIRQNGNAEDKPAVVIEQGGGRSLVYNSLFHSNSGISLKNKVDTIFVAHNTFALNGGNVHMENNHSKISGCVLWRNNQAPSFRNSQELDFKFNTEGTTMATPVTYNALTSVDGHLGDNMRGGYNQLLSMENEDIFFGPNFMNPDLEASTFEAVSQRNFHLKPSRYLLNQGSHEDHEYWVMVYPGMPGAAFKKQMETETDLSGNLRKFGTRIDLGAYEYRQPLLRVLYVDAQRTMPGNGTSWEDAYNRNEMQIALDMAAIYSASTEKDNRQEQAYVYVKSRNDGQHTADELKLRDGVSVFGSIPQNYQNLCEYTNTDGFWKYEDGQVQKFMDRIRMERPGMASPDEYKTRIASLKAEGEYGVGALIDGVEITGHESDDVKTGIIRPAVDFSNIQYASNTDVSSPLPLALRNAIVHGYRSTAGPVVRMDNGLLYNVLVRDNEVPDGQSVILLGRMAYAVNSTLTGPAARIVGGDGGPYNQLHCITGVQDLPTFNPYLRPQALKPVYKTQDRNLWYQLTEESAHIDQAANLEGLPATLKKFINYATDRDILGNPRQIATEAATVTPVDNGCYETWKLQEASAVEAQVTENGLPYCPHPGSVVYLKQNASLLLGEPEVKGLLPDDYVFRPGFLLMGEGASVYGNGNKIQVGYVSTEKTFKPFTRDGQIWSQLALPYDFHTDYLTSRTYQGEQVNETPEPSVFYRYDGATRAEFDYAYQPTESDLWKRSSSTIQANEGILLNISPGASSTPKIYRFTSISPVANRYVYEEDGSPKSVELVQHNYTPKGSARFTSEENMGWNIFGQPYLVSSYTTGTEWGDGQNCPMNFPHIVYGLDEVKGTYLPGETWKSGYAMSLGQGYFTQTATLSDRESVVFELPVYREPVQQAIEQQIRVCSKGGDDVVTVRPDAEAGTEMTYRMGADAIKWMAVNENAPQIYTFNADDTRFSLLAAAPEETEIGLGVKAGEAGNYTISLPDKEVYAEYHAVWLKDSKTGNCTNLLRSDYTLLLDEQEDCKGRLTLQFGGQQPGISPDGSETPAPYHVYVGGGYLHIDGLHGGEHIAIYNATGQLVEQAEATDISYQTRLVQGVYVVKVNRQIYKILY